jgi:membrane protease YdiL (CAAX protease family)
MLVHPLWSVLSAVNLAHTPALPWAAPTMVLLLFLLWAFLDGRLGPTASRSTRRALLQWRWSRRGVRAWAAAATVLGMGAMFLIDTHSYLVTNAFGSPPRLSGLPLCTGVSFLLVQSSVAALVEECAFRGYMQSDLATRFGFSVTAALVAVAFALFHLYGRTFGQWTAGLFGWLVISVVFSALVWLSKSLLPAVLGHFAVDVGLFCLDWFDDVLRPLRRPLWGLPISVGAALFAVLALASGWAFLRLKRASAVATG